MWNDEESREVFKAFRQSGRRATQLLKGYVKNGNADAMVVLALRNRTNAEDTVNLLKQATRQGNVYAQLHLGWEYFWGKNIRRNRPLALKLITESADRGSNSAAMWLAEHFLEDNRPEKDVEKGIALLNQVANRQEYQPCIQTKEIEACDSYLEYIQLMEGYAIAVAQENLYVLYESGLHGLPQDNERAAYWLVKLYAYGLTEVAWDLVALYEKLGKNDQAEPILEALVKTDDPEAMYALAHLWKQSNDREKQHHAFNLEQRAKKLKVAAAPLPPASPQPPSPPSRTGQIFVPVWSPTFRSPRIATNRSRRITAHEKNQSRSPLDKLEEVIHLLERSPPEYAKAHRILYERDMLYFQPAAEYRQKVALYLAHRPLR